LPASSNVKVVSGGPKVSNSNVQLVKKRSLIPRFEPVGNRLASPVYQKLRICMLTERGEAYPRFQIRESFSEVVEERFKSYNNHTRWINPEIESCRISSQAQRRRDGDPDEYSRYTSVKSLHSLLETHWRNGRSQSPRLVMSVT
jgi:hypothetical protein